MVSEIGSNHLVKGNGNSLYFGRYVWDFPVFPQPYTLAKHFFQRWQGNVFVQTNQIKDRDAKGRSNYLDDHIQSSLSVLGSLECT